MTQKQRNELKIFESVYKDVKFINLIAKDKPDFWASVENGVYFGVEVTELFKNDSDARLRHIPNYWSDLLDKKEARHKDDKEHLIVDELVLISPDGTEVTVDAIVQKFSSLETHLTNVNARIADKNKRLENYKADLSHSNLILHDSSGFYSATKTLNFYNLFFNKLITSTIYNSKFREIYYVVNLANLKHVFPLKRLLLASRIFLFQEVLIKASADDLTEDNYYYRLAEFLLFQGAAHVGILSKPDAKELIFGNTGFTLRGGKEVIFRDYGDLNIATANYVTFNESEFIDSRIENIIREVEQNFSFETELSFPSKS